MTTSALPTAVITEDHQLDRTASDAQEQLARLRWHWTLDETNPKRVSFGAYGEAVGRSVRAISTMVNGYAAFRAESVTEIGNTRSLTDEIELAKIGATKRIATEALAQAQGLTIANVASSQRERVNDVVTAATDAAERRGTSIEEEIPRVALSHHRTREAAARNAKDRKARSTLRYIEMEGDFSAAKRRLLHALDVAHDVGFNDEELAMLRQTIAQLTSLLNLIDLRLGGMPDVDWNAELAKLGAA